MSLILTTTLFYKALILQGENWCWSLLGLKGLRAMTHTPVTAELTLCYGQSKWKGNYKNTMNFMRNATDDSSFATAASKLNYSPEQIP